MGMIEKTKPGHQYRKYGKDWMVVEPSYDSNVLRSSLIKDIKNSSDRTFVVNLETGELTIHHYPNIQLLFTNRSGDSIELPVVYEQALSKLQNVDRHGFIHCPDKGLGFQYNGDASKHAGELAILISRLSLL